MTGIHYYHHYHYFIAVQALVDLVVLQWFTIRSTVVLNSILNPVVGNVKNTIGELPVRKPTIPCMPEHNNLRQSQEKQQGSDGNKSRELGIEQGTIYSINIFLVGIDLVLCNEGVAHVGGLRKRVKDCTYHQGIAPLVCLLICRKGNVTLLGEKVALDWEFLYDLLDV
mmetsp:Transcript_883/g.1823  ORF Transcript_883/g.1823 Transcript_883/m.1823 type:complete len:168 (-) Transcript_883:520-1023(-)